MKPEGSTRRTRPRSGWSPPHCSISTGCPARTRDGGARQQVGDDLEIAAGCRPRAAAARSGRPSRSPGDGAGRRRPPASRAGSSRALARRGSANRLARASSSWCSRGADGELRGLQRTRRASAACRSARLELSRRATTFSSTSSGAALQLRLRERELGADAFPVGAGAAERRLRRAHARLELRSRPHVQQRGIGRLETRDDGLAGHDAGRPARARCAACVPGSGADTT